MAEGGAGDVAEGGVGGMAEGGAGCGKEKGWEGSALRSFYSKVN